VWRAVEGPNMPARIKVALAYQGRPVGEARSPSAQVTEADREAIAAALDSVRAVEGFVAAAR